MMNTAQLAEALKTVPDQYLVSAVQGGNPNAPGYLALAEMQRRQQLRAGGSQQPAPMSTVAQDETQQTMQSAMPQQGGMGIGIGGVRGFADGGLIKYGGVYGGEDLLPTTTGYEGLGILDVYRKMLGPAFEALMAENPRLRAARQEREMKGYVPRYTPPGPPQWTITESAEPGEPQVAPQAAPPTIPTTQPAGGGISSVRGRVSVPGAAGITRAPEMPSLPEAPEIKYKDASEYLSKIPTSKILEQMAKEAQVDKEEFKRQREEARNLAITRFAAGLASRPGGLGGALAPALSEALEYKRGIGKEISAAERQARKDLQAVQLQQAAEEVERFKTAQGMSKQEYEEQKDNFARKFNVSKEKTDTIFKQAELNQRREIAELQARTTLSAAAMRAEGGGGGLGDDIMRAFTAARSTAATQAAKDAEYYEMRPSAAMKKFGTKDINEIREKLTTLYFSQAVRENPVLQQYSSKIPTGAAMPASAGPAFVTPPSGVKVRE